MIAQENPPGDPDERLGEAIASYLNAAEQGEPVHRTAFLARHPEFRSELEVFFENHDGLQDLSRPLRESIGIAEVSWTGRHVGDYEILREIARGGMGVVYEARHAGLGRTVALKTIRAGHLATEEDLERFRTEARAAASLSHPNIVPIHHFGQQAGQQYFTMELIQGRTLDQLDCDFRSDPQEAARLLALVARAVHHAHQRRIIHRDLKPGNILVDEAGQPHVTDFGLAMQVEGGDRLTESHILLGTLPYMTPEQLSDKVQPLTTSIDIWSLGVILYELLTGTSPFQGNTQAGTMDRIRKHDPVPVRTLNPHVSRDLEAICLRCLEKEPERRYGSAMGLARDLERWMKREPIEARPVRKVVRAWSWCRRNPAGAGLAFGAAILVVVAALGTIFRISENRAREDEIKKGLVFTARFASNVILNRMREWGSRVEAQSRSPELIGLLSAWNESLKARPSIGPEDILQRPEAKKVQAFLDELQKEPLVVNWQIVDIQGLMLARTPAAVIGVDFRKRDYFAGTLKHLGRSGLASVHVSSVYPSQADGLDKFDICAPVMADGIAVGVVALSVTTDPTLGVPHMLDQGRKVVLVAPWDPSPPHKPLPPEGAPEFVVLLHPEVTPGQKAVTFDKRMFPAAFPRHCEQELQMTDDPRTSALARRDYRDPFEAGGPDEHRRWFAGFAPVGNTGFVVIVQQRGD